MTQNETKPGFAISSESAPENSYGKGFYMTFDNGWTVSVQFGSNNYCDNREFGGWRKPQKGASPDAEIAAWPGSEGAWYNFGGDTVKGWCSPSEVLAFMNEIAALAPGPIPVGQKGAARQQEEE